MRMDPLYLIFPHWYVIFDAAHLQTLYSLHQDEPGDGLFSEGCFCLVEGEYTEEATLEIIAIGQPPCESRDTARCVKRCLSVLKDIPVTEGQFMVILIFSVKVQPHYQKTQVALVLNFIFLIDMIPQSQFKVRIQEELPELHFFFLSDVWLDHPQALPGIQKMFDNCIENDFIPKVIVMCGNFTSKSIAHGNGRDVQRYTGRARFVEQIFSTADPNFQRTLMLWQI